MSRFVVECNEGGGAVVFLGGVGHFSKLLHVLRFAGAFKKLRCGVGSLHRGNLHAIGGHRQLGEQLGDGRGGAVAGHKMALAYLAAQRGEHFANLVERGGTGLDGLVLVAQKQEIGTAEVTRQDGELCAGVILHFVDHHVFRIGVAHAGDSDFRVQPFKEGKLFNARDALGDTVDAQPVVVFHGIEGAFVLLGKELQRVLFRLLLGFHGNGFAEDAQLVVVGKLAYHVLRGAVACHLA